ncbi:hypothetical protein OGAPHI_001130 [Ogataea philodendri]|uniref:Uncharacterized protein n=2 Tax=Saccharomycotina TaxID=147537 RepID=A0A9P8PFI6_9ASCO|nr:uncharacterized protein OGAPHI_001130 [Ogataea philodendri]KAH3670615.1 hypothetical protein OGAPHI_001130 [Ogataea philodendri]
MSSYYLPLSLETSANRRLVLENGINVLLVSDPTLDSVGCGFSVAVGHHSNPPDSYGLAHFCEHMVCVSSKEFKETDLCKKLVYKSGGRWNAVTVGEKTSFFFEVPVVKMQGSSETVFEQLLKVFPSCFRSPAFDYTYAKREMVAVDNEHTKNRCVVGKIAHHGLKLLANPNHPFHQFSTGNFDTLSSGRKSNVKDELVQFFNQNYHAWKSALVLKGPQSLNVLQKLAVANFSDCLSVKPKETTNVLKTSWDHVYQSKVFTDFGKMAVIESQGTSPILRVYFPFEIADKDSLVFAQAWCYIMGSENQVSFNAQLFDAGLVKTSVSSAPIITFKDRVLQLEFNLTPMGAREYGKILDYLIKYTEFVFSSDPKRVKRMAKLLSQFNSIELYNFIHHDPDVSISAQCRILSQRLLEDQKINNSWLFKSSPCWGFDDPGYSGSYEESSESQAWWINKAGSFSGQICRTVSRSNILATLVADSDVVAKFGHSFSTDQYFQFKFKIVPIEYEEYVFACHLQRPNQFVVGQIDNQTVMYRALMSSMRKSQNFVYATKREATPPVQLNSPDNVQLWYQKDTDKYQEKVFLTVELTNPMKPCVETTLSLEMFCDIVKEHLRETLYPALELYYAFDIVHAMKGNCGIVVHVSGSSVGVYEIFNIIMETIKTLSKDLGSYLTPAMFRKSRIRIKMKYENLRTLRSHELASLGLVSVLESCTWGLDDRLEALEELDLVSVSQLMSKVFRSCHLVSFLHGDAEISDYQKVISSIQSTVDEFSPKLDNTKTLELPVNCNYRIHGHSPDETNALVSFTQLGRRENVYERSMARFAAYILSTLFAAKLRTQYQLGYVVFVGLRTLKETVGIHFTIMSGDFTPLDLDAKIEEILKEWFVEFQRAGARFETEKQNFLQSYLRPSQESSSLTFGAIGTSLGDGALIKEHQNFWDQIYNQSFRFSSSGHDDIDRSVIDRLEFADFAKYLDKKMLSEDRSKLSIMLATKLDAREAERKLRPMRLQMFLTAAGLPVKGDKIKQIVDEAGDSQTQLVRLLFKHYQGEGSSIRLISTAIAKIAKDLFARSKKIEVSTVASTEIINLDSWKHQLQEV